MFKPIRILVDQDRMALRNIFLLLCDLGLEHKMDYKKELQILADILDIDEKSFKVLSELEWDAEISSWGGYDKD